MGLDQNRLTYLHACNRCARERVGIRLQVREIPSIPSKTSMRRLQFALRAEF
jgi:hypothetical protein